MTSPGYIVGVFEDATLLVGAGVNLRGAPDALVPMYLSYHRYSADGEPGDTLIEFLGPARRMLQADYGSNPWEPYPLEVVRAVHGDRFYLGASRAFEIGEYSADGSLKRLIRADHLDLRLTREHQQEYFDFERASSRYAEERQSFERGFLQIEFPETIPPYQELIVDSEDHLWVMHFHPPSHVGPTRWSVFAPEGHLLGIVEMPDGFIARQIGRDFLLGVWRDELDVPYVRMYGLERLRMGA